MIIYLFPIFFASLCLYCVLSDKSKILVVASASTVAILCLICAVICTAPYIWIFDTFLYTYIALRAQTEL